MAEPKPKHKPGFYIFLAVDAVLLLFCVIQIFHPILRFGPFTFFHPQGIIARQEESVLIKAVLIMMIAVVPVYVLLFFFIWKYRASKAGEEYSPRLQSNALSTLVLWAIPVAVIAAVGVLNWQSTHELDPSKPIVSSQAPLTIQVIALQWKWLFIYPKQNIATVNFVKFPENTPVSFELTADAPMSSFWIPQLGSQIYAMAAMSTRLNLMADKPGDFEGKDTEINGAGFSGMRFVARSATAVDFTSWVKATQKSGPELSLDAYNQLAKPTENNPVSSYSPVRPNLYNQIIMKYLTPRSTASSSPPMIMDLPDSH